MPLRPRSARRRRHRAATAVLAALVVVVGWMRLDAVCGLFSDDSWYVLLAKALAAGDGYTLVNAPVPGGLPKYPPGFPLVLAAMFTLAPAFPANVVLLKAVSIAALAGVGVLTVVHCRRDRRMTFPLAWAIGAATALHPGLIFLATSTVMSECVFTFVQLAAVLAVEHAARRARTTTVPAAVAGALASFAFLTRTFGVAVLVAGVVRLGLARRGRAALAFVAAAAVVSAPWWVYSRAHPNTPAVQARQNDSVLYGYDVDFWLRAAGHGAYGTVTARDLPARVASQATAIARSTMGALHLYAPYRTVEPAAWGAVPPWAHAVGWAATALVALGFARTVATRVTAVELLVSSSLGIAMLWPFPPTRFVLPLLPFVLTYTARALGRSALATLLVGALATASLVTDLRDAAALHGPPEARPRWNRVFDDEMDLMRWIDSHVPRDDVVATLEPAFVHLYTGRRTVGAWDAGGGPWRAAGARVLADTSYAADEAGAARFPLLYRPPGARLGVHDLSSLYADRRR